jgi:hypothetical protein
MKEVTHYSDGAVTITNARAVLGSEAYSMAHITYAAMVQHKANRLVPALLLVVSSVMGLAMSLILFNSPYELLDIAYSAVFVFAAFAAGLVWLASARDKFFVRVYTPYGKVDAVMSEDRTYVAHIVRVLNRAIVERA